jgi:sec-independent protein translocase protein TatA
MPNLGPWEIVLLLFLAMMLFGAKRLPELGRSVGQSMREFKHSIRDETEDVRNATGEIRGEFAGLRQSVTGTTTDIRGELTMPALDTVPATPASQPEQRAV